MKRYFTIFVILSLFLLWACGYDAYDPALFGHYTGTTIDAEGYTIDMTSVYAGSNYIELSQNGKGKLCLSNHVYEMEWGMNGSDFTLVALGEKSEGTLKNGVILLNYLGMDMELRFEFDANWQAPATMPREAAVTEAQKWWNGDWYGWWVIDEATGAYAAERGSWWDLCADIYTDEDGRGEMLLWDEEYSRNVPLGLVHFAVGADGIAHSENGEFGVVEVGNAWHIDPNAYALENFIVVEGIHEDENGGFSYKLYLRPWGQDWSDAENKPYYYDTWYLPLIESQKPMPDHIG